MGKHESWVFADGDRFRWSTGDVRIVSTRPEANCSLGPILRDESDFLVVDVKGNFAGRLPRDAAVYREHGRHFRHHPDQGYKAPGTDEDSRASVLIGDALPSPAATAVAAEACFIISTIRKEGEDMRMLIEVYIPELHKGDKSESAIALSIARASENATEYKTMARILCVDNGDV